MISVMEPILAWYAEETIVFANEKGLLTKSLLESE